MSKITALKKQESRDRVSVFINEKYSFSLSINQFADQKLSIGQEISPSDISCFKDMSSYGKVLENAIAWSLRRPHSERELGIYLLRKMLSPEHKEKITNYLLEKGYVDDKKFTKFWVQNRSKSKKPSKRLLIAELRSKGISQDMINNALDENQFNEEEMLKELIQKKKKLTRYKDPQKLIQYLARQGFSYDIIKKHLS